MSPNAPVIKKSKYLGLAGVLFLLLSLGAGLVLVDQQQNLRQKAAVLMCSTPGTEQCPVAGYPTHLRSCHPGEKDGSPSESLCYGPDVWTTCGPASTKWCCPKANGNWTTDLTMCPSATGSTISCHFEGCSACGSHPGYSFTYDPACSTSSTPACVLGCGSQFPTWSGEDAPGYVNTNGDQYTRSATCQAMCGITTPPGSVSCHFEGCSTSSHLGYYYSYNPTCSGSCSLGCGNQWPSWLGEDDNGNSGYANTNGDDYVRTYACQVASGILAPTPPAVVEPTLSPSPTPQPPSKPTVVQSCNGTMPGGTVTWTGTPNPSFGFTVNISETPGFAVFWNKNVGTALTTTLDGFVQAIPSTGNPFSLQVGHTYYVNVYNGNSGVTSDSFVVNSCTSSCVPTNPWDINQDGTTDIIDIGILLDHYNH